MDNHKPDFMGESESFSDLRTMYPVCQDSDIQSIECREKSTQKAINETGMTNVMCDIASGGFMCFALDQPSGQCSDIEIRVFCEPKGMDCFTGAPNLVTTIGMPTTTCGDHWSPWINNGSPSKPNGSGMSGDKEMSAAEYRTQTGFCSNGKISNIECQTTDGTSSDVTGQIVDCTIETGLECMDDFNFPDSCHDYQIRYFCEDRCGK